MKKRIHIFVLQNFNSILEITSVRKRVIFVINLFILLFLFSFVGFTQSDGDYRSAKTGGGWGSAGTFEVYSAVTDIWVTTPSAWAASTAYSVGTQRSNGGNLYVVTIAGTSAASGGPTGTSTSIIDGTVTWNYMMVAPAITPPATANVTIMDGVFQTSNVSGPNAANLTVGQGNAFSGTAVLTGTAVTSVIINNAGALMANPGVTFIGAGTTVATATATFKMVGAYYRSKGTGYTNATVTFGSAWSPGTAYAIGNQRTNNGNFYTVTTAGTSAASGGPTGTGTGIVDNNVVWSYAGSVPTAHATINGGQITGIVIDDPGSNYIASGASLPNISITGDGSGASYAIQMGVDNIVITNGGNYAVAPQVLVGSVDQIGNTGTTVRTLTVSGNLTVKNGANFYTGGGSSSVTQNLIIGGNLIAESPVNFTTVVPTSTSSTNVTFNKANSISAISGTGPITFNNLTVGATTSLINNSNITINGSSNYNSITAFNITSPSVTGTINQTDHTVSLSVAGGASLTNLVPNITLLAGGSISPASGVSQDFTNPVSYTVTAKDGATTQLWTVTAIGGITIPVSPVASAATNVSQISLIANWEPSSNATGYYLDVATDNTFTNMVSGFNNKDVLNVTTLSVSGLVANTTYYYRVRAYNVAGTSVNSNIITATTIATIQPQTITFSLPEGKVYGDAPFDITDLISGGSGNPVVFVSSDLSVATIYGNTVTILKAGTTTIEGNQAGGGSYLAASPVKHDLVIGKAMLTVTTESVTRLRGLPNPAFVLKYIGFKGQDDKASLTTEPTATCSATYLSPLGDYSVVLSGGTATNYNFTYVDGKLTVTSPTLVESVTNKEVKVFPNPVSDKLIISLTNNIHKGVVEVYMANGSLVSTFKIQGSKAELDLSGYASGSYIVKVITNDTVIVKQLVKY